MDSTRTSEPTGSGARTAESPPTHAAASTDESSTDRGDPSSSSGQPASRHWVARVGPYLVVGSAYLLLSVIMWIHVWTGHPSSVTTCGCGDTSATIWYTAWPAYAMAHGLNPLYSTAIGYPTGVNLVFAAYGIVMAPVTWLFGPVSSVNVILTVSPVLSAVAMFALVRRWVSWMPAAFLAGLFYGFSPFVVNNLGVAHVDFIMIAIPPLVVLCLDELLIRQQRRPAVVGVVMGLLFTAQFFVGAELLTITIIEAAIGIVMIALYTAVQSPKTLREHATHAVTGGVASCSHRRRSPGLSGVVCARRTRPFFRGRTSRPPVDRVFGIDRQCRLPALPREGHAVATHCGCLSGSDALLPVFWPGGDLCVPGRTHCLAEGPTPVAVWSAVRRHAAPRHVVGSLARDASARKERVPPSFRSSSSIWQSQSSWQLSSTILGPRFVNSARSETSLRMGRRRGGIERSIRGVGLSPRSWWQSWRWPHPPHIWRRAFR